MSYLLFLHSLTAWQLSGDMIRDTITLTGSNFTVLQQDLAVVKAAAPSPDLPQDGLIGFAGVNNSILDAKNWFLNLCADRTFPECRFGLALKTDDTGTQYLGGLEEDSFKGELSTTPIEDQWITWGDVTFNGQVFERDARMLTDSGTAVIFGLVLPLFS